MNQSLCRRRESPTQAFCRNMRQNARCPAKANITPTPLHSPFPPEKQNTQCTQYHGTNGNIFYIINVELYFFCNFGA